MKLFFKLKMMLRFKSVLYSYKQILKNVIRLIFAKPNVYFIHKLESFEKIVWELI